MILVWLTAPRVLPLPEDDKDRHENDAGERIDRVEPRHRNVEAEEIEVDVIVDPDESDVRVLVIGDRVKDRESHHGDERDDDAPVGGSVDGVRLFAYCARRRLHERVVADEVRREPAKHQHTGETKADVPAVFLREQSAHEWADDRADG